MTNPLNWRTSTYTKTDNCVEIADNDPAKVRVRDTKDRGLPRIETRPKAWGAFIDYVRTHAF
ncbi:DUF397 domain-containing protein [Streptomyces xanthochromogenes]|uniref:DUF397 domain-containing protein n=1 Tax=Streptomyces TaxID=1883 RepID=UPI0013688E68|nr:DUF397 domain-containing protein [Streptomyces sp. SID1034]MYV91330.1 DUF397 domain-containing protein [Streptomyces sp. SID1034]